MREHQELQNLHDEDSRHEAAHDFDADKLIKRREELDEEVSRYSGSEQQARHLEFIIKIDEEQKEKQINVPFHNLIKKIIQETNALKDIEDTVSTDNLIIGLKKTFFPMLVEFGSEELKRKNEYAQLQNKKHTTLGTYNIVTEEIKILEEAPSKMEIWGYLTGGFLHEVIQTLDHEFLHYYFNQAREAQRREHLKKAVKENLEAFFKLRLYWSALSMVEEAQNILSKFRVNSLLSFRNIMSDLTTSIQKFIEKKRTGLLSELVPKEEKSAQEQKKAFNETVAQKSAMAYWSGEYTTFSVVTKLAEAYGFNKPEQIDFIAIASQSIDRLKALGKSDREIAEMFTKAEYDTATVSIPYVEDKIKALAEEQNISLENLDTKVDLMRIQQEIDMLEASKIARDELDTLCRSV